MDSLGTESSRLLPRSTASSARPRITIISLHYPVQVGSVVPYRLRCRHQVVDNLRYCLSFPYVAKPSIQRSIVVLKGNRSALVMARGQSSIVGQMWYELITIEYSLVVKIVTLCLSEVKTCLALGCK